MNPLKSRQVEKYKQSKMGLRKTHIPFQVTTTGLSLYFRLKNPDNIVSFVQKCSLQNAVNVLHADYNFKAGAIQLTTFPY